MRKLRILAIGHSYVLRVNRAIAREVARDPAFEVTIGAPRFFHGDLRPIECEPEPTDSPLKLVQIPAYWTKRIHVFRYSRKPLSRLILEGRFDGIHAWEEPYIFAGYQIARLAKRSRSPFCFQTDQNLSKPYPPPFSFFEKSCVRNSHRWIACGRSVFNNVISRDYPVEHGCVLAHAVDTNAFRPAPESERDEVRRQLKLQSPVIGFVGRLVPAKGLRILMQALENLDARLSWSLILLGSGEMQAEIEQWAARLGWQHKIKIHLAKHDDVPRYLAAMDLLVAPSQTMPNWKEQFGRMLIEAFACGVPVIASDSGEIPFVVDNTGLIVPEANVPAWSKAIGTMLRDSDLRERLRAAGLARVDAFSAKQVASEYRGFYVDLATHSIAGAETSS